MLELQIDGQTIESWNDIVAKFADANIYQTWAYGSVRWGSRSLSHLVLRKHGDVVAAAQLRIAKLPFLPAGIAYLRWGPLVQRLGQPLVPSVVIEMLACLRREYSERRGLAFEIIANAFPGDARGDAFQKAFERLAMLPSGTSYRTVLVDLSPPAEFLRKRLDQKWRNQLNRAEKNGVAVDVDSCRDAYRDFVRLYETMRGRKRFESSVDVKEFDRVQELLGVPTKMQTFLARENGQSIGALVISLMGDTAIYLLGATNARGRELKAAYLLHWQAMLWSKERGASCYDLGGIDPEANPGGCHFKSGFGGTDTTHLSPHTISASASSNLLLRTLTWWRNRPKSRRSLATTNR